MVKEDIGKLLRTGQSKLHSFIEACINTAIGYAIAVLTQALVFPLFGLNASLKQNLEIGLIFTLISIARSYALRRIFNWYHHRDEKFNRL